ncbi:MAG: trypsin-like peptidase domain-containing protein [Chloroflexi bacterium]|nr:trypsin-like peptidase domain-containing protein [Chloroflexota bacterium]
MQTRADRPYGRFPGSRDAEEAGVAAAPAAARLRDRILGTGRVRRIRIALTSALVLLIVAGTFGATQPGARLVAARPTPAPSPTVQQIYEAVAPSVVSIRTVGHGEPTTGAGVIVDDMATILTSLHVVRDAERIRLTFSDGTISDAQIVGSLPERDIAVLQPLSAPALVVPAVLGDPNRLRMGDGAYVIGDPFGLSRSYTVGVISGLDRTVRFESLPQPLSGLIQFDAAANPGSSGGPLIDGRGEVVGIVTGVLGPPGQRSFSGLGFAVRIDAAASGLGVPPD